jgi:acetyl esterase/lipase
MSGFAADFRPKAIVSFYGYGDIIGAWYSRPDPWYRSQGLIPIDEAYNSIGDQPCTDTGGKNRFLFYLYCRQHGLWPREVGGQDPHENPGWFSRFCPVLNVSSAYPPTLLIHGDQDTDVPYQQSVEMDAALEQHQVEHRFLTLKDKGHAFDEAKEAQADTVISGCFDEVVDFLNQHNL